MSAPDFWFATLRAPIGPLRLVASSRGIVAILRGASAADALRFANACRADDHPALVEAIRQLREYFARRRTAFELAIDDVGSPFQIAVWRAIATIPYAESRSYAEVAHVLGNFRAARSVGSAIGANPIAIVRPDHRVVASNGGVRGGSEAVAIRTRLLAFERGATLRAPRGIGARSTP